MTIQSLQELINEYKELVVNSGLFRDINGYLATFSQQHNQTNLILLKDITEKMIISLEDIYSMHADNFQTLFPASVKAFTTDNFLHKFHALKENTSIQVNDLFSQLNTILTRLKNAINSNIAELEKLEAQIAPFLNKIEYSIKEKNKAILSIDFKDKDTISSLKYFSKTLNKWDRSLNIYHQLLSSKPPQDITLVDIENGSIDIIINLDFEVAKSLLELFSAGLTAFTTYLLWKVQRESMAKSYNGNEKLLALDKEYEKELINNVIEAVNSELVKQYEEKIKIDSKIDSTSLDVKRLEISSLIQEHIVKGNDIRLIHNVENEELEQQIKETQKLSKKARKDLKNLPKSELIKMLNEFIPNEEQEEPKKSKKK